MSDTALSEAAKWTEILLNAEFQGRKDREGPVRYRMARKLGIPESYIYRLQYKTSTMSDVRGSVYRALQRAHQAYERLCERNEAAADAYEAERQILKAERHAKTSGKPAPAGLEETAAQDRAA